MRRLLRGAALALSLASATAALAEPGEASFTPTHLKLPIRRVTLEGAAGTATIYRCQPSNERDCLVDVADNRALAQLFAQPSAIPAGIYDRVGVYNCDYEQQFTAEVQGSVVVDGVTWYTAGAAVLSTDRGDLASVRVPFAGCKGGPSLPSPIAVRVGDDLSVSAFFSLANVGWVTSGQTPGGCALTPSGTARSVCVQLPELVTYMGTTAPTVESYAVTEDPTDVDATQAGGAVMLLVDSGGDVFGGFLRRLFSPRSHAPRVSYDVPLTAVMLNADGYDYTLDGAGDASEPYVIRFPAFERRTHAGFFVPGDATAPVPYRAVKQAPIGE